MGFDERTAEVWADLRATRPSPPGRAASNKARREVYVSALEQAEQLFTAAANVGCASRPLLIFYGLSQAGRAIAAAATSITGDDWRLQGHGLTPADLTEELPKVAVRQRGKANTSFNRLSVLLNSPMLSDGSDPVTIARLWDMIPEGQERPLLGGSTTRRPTLYVELHDIPMHPLMSGSVCFIPFWLAEAPDRAAAFAEYMAAYPHAAGYGMQHPPERTDWPNFEVNGDYVQLLMHWRAAADDDTVTIQLREETRSKVLTAYGDRWYLMPAAPGCDRPLHPLMSWWALLFTLSMLARYHPAEWRRHIDVDHSIHAVPLETLLEQSLLAVPRIVHSTLREVTRPENQAL